LFLECIKLYTDNARVYKIILSSNPDQLKRAAKVGIKARFTIIEDNIPQIPISNPTEFEISKGQFFLQYSLRTHDTNIFPGEDYFLNKRGQDAKQRPLSKLCHRIARRNELLANQNVPGNTDDDVHKTNDNSADNTVLNSGSG
jgi:hypothetical protein